MSRKKVLVVDDDPNIVRALTLRLQENGYDVQAAGDAIQAIMKARQMKPDIILLDIMMPAGNGFCVYERLRAFPDCWNTPVIFLTADATEQSRRRAEKLGARFYVTKPYDWNVLSKYIEEIMNGST